MERLEFPLNSTAVQAANRALWRNHPELDGRQLTMSPEDGALRAEWTRLYRAALPPARAAEPPAPVPELIANCPAPAPSCADLWAQVDQEVDSIASITDPIERNRKISKAYGELFQRQPKYQWIGLAAVVSR